MLRTSSLALAFMRYLHIFRMTQETSFGVSFSKFLRLNKLMPFSSRPSLLQFILPRSVRQGFAACSYCTYNAEMQQWNCDKYNRSSLSRPFIPALTTATTPSTPREQIKPGDFLTTRFLLSYRRSRLLNVLTALTRIRRLNLY